MNITRFSTEMSGRTAAKVGLVWSEIPSPNRYEQEIGAKKYAVCWIHQHQINKAVYLSDWNLDLDTPPNVHCTVPAPARKCTISGQTYPGGCHGVDEGEEYQTTGDVTWALDFWWSVPPQVDWPVHGDCFTIKTSLR